MKTARVKFKDSKYNYVTSVNGKLSDEDIKAYFVNTVFNVGNYPIENMQRCIGCEVSQDEI